MKFRRNNKHQAIKQTTNNTTNLNMSSFTIKCSICNEIPVEVYRKDDLLYCEDCVDLTDTEVLKDNVLQSIINSMTIRCKNALCEESMAVKDYNKHLLECKYSVIECAYARFGCDYSAPRFQYLHDPKKCPYYVSSVVEKAITTSERKLLDVIERNVAESRTEISDLYIQLDSKNNIISMLENNNYILEKKIDDLINVFKFTSSISDKPVAQEALLYIFGMSSDCIIGQIQKRNACYDIEKLLEYSIKYGNKESNIRALYNIYTSEYVKNYKNGCTGPSRDFIDVSKAMKYLKIGGEEGYEWCIEKLIDAYNNGYIEYSKLDNTRDRLFIKIDIEQAEYWKAKQQSQKN